MAAPPPRITNFLILPHPREPRILLTEDAGPPSLPSVEETERRHWANVAPLVGLVKERLGLRATVLRCGRSRVDRGAGVGTRIYVMEIHGGAEAPPGTRWGDGSGAAESLADPDLRSAVAAWSAERSGGRIDENRQAWAHPGWFATTSRWMRREIVARGMTVTGAIQQVRAWTISSVLKAPTASGDVFLKTSGTTFPSEARVTLALARVFPWRLPGIVAVDPARSQLLMRDLGGTRLDRSADLGQWKAALRAYAGMQIQSIGAIDDLLAAGCQNRRLAGLHDRIDADLADTAAMMPDDPDPLTADALTEEEVDRVRSQAGRLHDAVDTLARGPVPETLDHGDLHAGNIVETGSTMRIFDWSDACIGHPFFSLLTFLDFHAPPGGAGGRQALETAYLEPWTSFAPMPALRDALAAATPLAVMHQVSSYRHILRTVEPALRWEWASVVPYFLRMLLRGGR